MAGLSAGGIFNFLVATDSAAGQAKLNRDLYKARKAKNDASAKESTLANWSQSLSNSKLMEKAGKSFNTISENITRQMDAQTMTGIQRDLALSERLGAATAAFSASGMGGSSTEVYNQTVRTSEALQAELMDRNFRSSNYLTSQERGSIIPNAVDAMSRDVIRANLDLTNYGSSKAPSLIGNLAALGVAAAASAAGAPDVGNAILKARTAGIQNQMGQGAQAAKTFGSALDDLKSGVNQVRDKFRFNGGPTLRPVDTSSWTAADSGMSSFLIR